MRHIENDEFEIFNTKSFTNANEYILRFSYNDGAEMDCVFDVEPLNKKIVKVPLGKEVDDNLSLVVTVLDKKKEIIYSQEQVIFEQKYQKMFANSPLFDGFKFENSKVVIELNNDEILTSNNEYNLLYRAGTDNDMDIFYNPGLAPYYEQSEKLLSKEDIPNGIKTVTEVTNKKGKYLVTDTYEGCDEGIIVTSTLKAIKAKGEIPRFGKCFYLPSSFESVRYIGRSGESYVDMKDQFIIKENVCRVVSNHRKVAIDVTVEKLVLVVE